MPPTACAAIVQRAAASAGAGDATAATALDRIERYAREHIGTDRVGSVRPLRRALDDVAAAQRALALAREQHDSYLAAEADSRSARARADRAEAVAAQAVQRHSALQRAAALQAEADMLRSAVETAEDRVLESAEAVAALRHRYDEAEQLHQTICEGRSGERWLASVAVQRVASGEEWQELPVGCCPEWTSMALARGSSRGTYLRVLPRSVSRAMRGRLPGAVSPGVARVAGVAGDAGDGAGAVAAEGSADVAALAAEFELAGAVARRHRDSQPAAVRIADPTTAAAVRVGPSALRDLAAQVDALTALIGESAGELLATDPPQRLTVRRLGLLGCAALALLGIVLAGFGEVLPGVVLLGLAVGAFAWAGRYRSALSVSALVPAGLAPGQVDAARVQLRAVAERCRRLRRSTCRGGAAAMGRSCRTRC